MATTHSYPLDNDGPLARAHFRAVLLLSLAAFVVALGILLLDGPDAQVRLIGIVGAVLFAVAFIVRRSGSGSVRLEREALVVTSAAGTLRVAWTDIDDIEIAPLARADRAYLRVMGQDDARAGVQLRLGRGIRLALLGKVHGTDVRGVPTGRRRVFLYPRDPDGFGAAVRERLDRDAAYRDWKQLPSVE